MVFNFGDCESQQSIIGLTSLTIFALWLRNFRHSDVCMTTELKNGVALERSKLKARNFGHL